MQMTSQERQWYQIIPASGMTADFINKPLYCLDPLWTIRTRVDDTPRLRDEVRKRLRELETYTEYAERQKVRARNPDQEFEIYVNAGNKEKVAHVDQLVREMKAEAESPLEPINFVLLLEKVQAIEETISGKKVQISLITELQRLGY